MPAAPVPRVSPRLLALFGLYAERYLRRHLHAVRVARGGGAADPGTAPLVVVLNHPSWWDPLVALALARHHYPGREHYAPIEAAALARYRFFAKLGFFGLDTTSPASVRSFLRTARAILARPRATLWITAQGRFADVRERPVVLRAGTGHVLRDMDRGAVIPLALEMGFWEERTPEAFALFGPAIDVDGHRGDDPAAWTARIATALEAAQDRLAEHVQRRDPTAFETLIGGAAGVGGIYDLWRRARARLRGERFRPEHGARKP